MIDLVRHGETVLRRALASGGAFAELFVEERNATTIRFEDGRIERVVSGTEAGAGVRLVTGDRTLYAYTNDLDLDGLLRAADTVAAADRAEPAAYSFDYRPQSFAMPVKVKPADVPTPRKAELAARANRAARALDPRVVQAAVVYADSLRHILIVNSEGRYVEDVRPQMLFMAHVVAAANGVIQTGYRTAGGALGFELFDTCDPEAVAETAARRACLMLEADPAPVGRMPVVLSSEAGGTMIHEAVGHGLEADLVLKNLSKYGGRLGDVIASPEVTVVDDGTLPGHRGSAHVDDEGTPAQRTVLVDQGRLVRFMNDLKSARKLGHAPTGNGRRESYQHKPVPRMTNTFIAPGSLDPDDILAETPRGLYVRRMGGGQVNTLNGEFVFEVSEGYLIEQGRLGPPVRGATLIGNGPDVMTAIERVGTDLGFDLGTCGKDGQGAPITSGQPTIRIRELTVGGTAGR